MKPKLYVNGTFIGEVESITCRDESAPIPPKYRESENYTIFEVETDTPKKWCVHVGVVLDTWSYSWAEGGTIAGATKTCQLACSRIGPFDSYGAAANFRREIRPQPGVLIATIESL